MPYHAIRDPDQLQALLDAVLAIESGLELPGVLHRIAEAACSLTGARYGALGVLDPSGTSLAEFVHIGMDDATVEAIGHLPEGEGILGLLILDPLRSSRLRSLSVVFGASNTALRTAPKARWRLAPPRRGSSALPSPGGQARLRGANSWSAVSQVASSPRATRGFSGSTAL